MITIIALVLQALVSLIIPSNSDVVIIPPMPKHSPVVIPERVRLVSGNHAHECLCDDCCYDESYVAAYEEFTALFNSYSYKLSKNGRSMVNGKFVKMGA